MEIWKQSRVLYEGNVFSLRAGEVLLDDGTIAHREVIEHPGGVCIAPFDGEHVILVRQFRIAVNEYVLELPAGKLEGAEDPAHRAARELEEETGYQAGRLLPAGSFFMSVGFCTERMYQYLALDLTKTAQQLETEERIELVEMSLEKVRDGLHQHAFIDGKTALGLHALLHHLE